MVGKGAVRLAVQLRTSQPSRRRTSGAQTPATPLPASTTTFRGSGWTNQARDRVQVVGAGTPRSEGAPARLEVASLDEGVQRLDLFLGEGRRPGVDHLHPVVLDRIVAARDVGAAIEPPVRGGEVEQGRGGQADVDDVDAGRPRPVDESGLQSIGRDAVVLTDGDGLSPPAPDQGAVGGTDLSEDLGVDVVAEQPTHVVCPKDVRV